MVTENERRIERLEKAVYAVADVIVTYGEVEYAPLLDRLERELEYYREGRDPVSRARKILEASSSGVS